MPKKDEISRIKEDKVAKLKEWTIVKTKKTKRTHPPIESPCEGVIIAVGYSGDKGVLVHWPVRKGFTDPMDYEMVLGEELVEEAFFVDQPDYPGIFKCTVVLEYDPGGYWVGCDHIADPEWSFRVTEFDEIKISTRRKKKPRAAQET
jgi:hypothetical protein